MGARTELIELIKRHSSNGLKYTDKAVALADEILELMVPREVYLSAIEQIGKQELEIKTVRMLLAAKVGQSDTPVEVSVLVKADRGIPSECWVYAQNEEGDRQGKEKWAQWHEDYNEEKEGIELFKVIVRGIEVDKPMLKGEGR